MFIFILLINKLNVCVCVFVYVLKYWGEVLRCCSSEKIVELLCVGIKIVNLIELKV